MAVLKHTAAFDFLTFPIQHATATLNSDYLRAQVLLKAARKHFACAAGAFINDYDDGTFVNVVATAGA